MKFVAELTCNQIQEENVLLVNGTGIEIIAVGGLGRIECQVTNV